MTSAEHIVDLVIGTTPFGEPDARLAAAVCRAGGLGVLDLGTGDRRARDALAALRRWAPGSYGVRIGPRCRLGPDELGPARALTGESGAVRARTAAPVPAGPAPHAPDPARPGTVVLAPGAAWTPGDVPPGHRVLVEVTDLDSARAAVRSGTDGLIARGNECGGQVGELSTFVLLQQLLNTAELRGVPVWACGGIAPRTAAAAVVGGATGVVLDIQLALLADAETPEHIAAVLRTVDGSETVVAAGLRTLRRRGRPERGDAEDDRLPIGQDGFLAARFAERWGDTGRAVRAVMDTVRAAVREDTAERALGPGSAMSRALGTRLPVAQGPMTRVSDRADFADAVGAEGALPFIALALAGAEQSRTMLAEVGQALAGRPWGVGILGFAPEETRAAQLEAVLAARPTHAIVAGGRPSQARVLEEAGIRAFLHVPSPGLLRQFLDAGARRFVFEGAECGGHVGPRNSFPLWEAQLGVLEEFLDGHGGIPDRAGAIGAGTGAGIRQEAERIEVFLAGGIHDERSAAMAAALAAPLTARGCAVGVLMGTAYLFTDEAVTRGAVQPLFQRRVVAAERTALLETAPGHATRCVPSPFSDAFRTLGDDLRREGLGDREVWERLERLNVGRLRMAAKGLERTEGGALSTVGEERQLAEGMFMAGAVAVLRSATTTVAALHSAVSDGAARYLGERRAALRARSGLDPDRAAGREPAPPRPLDVAVIGMACMFPGAPDLASFWANVLDGVDSVGEVPPERWDPAVHGPEASGASASRWGGFLAPVPFDPLRYGIPPASLGSIEPVQLLALEAARRALEDAGLGPDGRDFDRMRTGVVFGAEPGSDLSNAATLRAVLPSYYGDVPKGLEGQLPALTEDSFPGMLSNVISGRIANRLDLGGPNFTVDAACASSLAAVDVACKELVAGTSDVMLCGGADLHNGINDYVLFSSVHALSPTGRSRAFDSGADGIALGEGVACVVLKRLADAERDGDRVYGVIKGVGSSSDGRSLGLTAPRPEGQRRAIDRAHRNAGTSPAGIGLVEAHGTGTVVGDRTELEVLTEVFEAAGAEPGSCVLGSVKSQIGHTKCAAGLAGLIKTVLAVHTGVRPPTLHLERPNRAWQEGRSPFVFHREALPWTAPPERRLAGLSAFGFGGTNFHVVLSAHGHGTPPAHGRDAWPAELFLFRGRDAESARRAVEELLALASADAEGPGPGRWRLRDLALAASRRAETGRGPVRFAVVAKDRGELCERLRRLLAGEHAPQAGIHVGDRTDGVSGTASGTGSDALAVAGPGRVAFLFPGQGSQRPGMFAEVFTSFPELHHLLARDGGAAAALLPPAAFADEVLTRLRTDLMDTRAAQPALGMVGLAAYTVLTQAGVEPDMAAGHSYGELVALCAAGVFDAGALLELSRERATAILASAGGDPGAMAAVSASAADIERALGAARATGEVAGVVIANHNAPRQTVLSGPTAAVDAAVRLLREGGHGAKRLLVACAFHSPLVAGAGDSFARTLAEHSLREPEFTVWSNRTARPYANGSDAIRAELAAQVGAPVRFAEQIEAMYEAGARVFVEAGPGRVLTRLVADVLGDRPHLAIACEPRPDSGLSGLLDALARLAVAGLPVRTGWMFRGRDAVDPGRAAAERQPGWMVDGHLVRTASGELLPGALAPARRVVETVETTVTTNHPTGAEDADGAAARQDALIAEFLRTSREMVAAQRDVLLTYFGGAQPVTDAGSAPAPPYAVPAAAHSPALPEPVPTPVSAVEAVQVRRVDEDDDSAGPGPTALSDADVLRMVVEIISERTGYPADMVEPGLDLEADLSIDSIKRTEIVGELAGRLVAAGAVAAEAAALDDAAMEELAKARTAEALAGRIAALATRESTDTPPRAPLPPSSATEATAAEATATGTTTTEAKSGAGGTPGATAFVMAAPKRFFLSPAPLPETTARDEARVTGRRFALIGDGDGEHGGVAAALTKRLADAGATAVRFPAGQLLTDKDGPLDGVILLDSLAVSGPPVLPGSFPVIKAALRARPAALIAVRRTDEVGGTGERAAGLSGLFRSVAREYPHTATTVIDLLPDTASGPNGPGGPAAVAAAVLEELTAPGGVPAVLRGRAGRSVRVLSEAPFGPLALTGAGPAGEGAAEAEAIGLGRDAVVLLTGGARGITAACAASLARACGCRIELLGRTPAPTGPEDPVTAAAEDEAALRGVLAARGRYGSPSEIAGVAGLILAQREITATLAALEAAGSRARYRSVDCRDSAAVLQTVKEIHAEHGRLDGVIHAAGVIEDRLIEEKSTESFERVYGTKVAGAASLLSALDELPDAPSFTVLFGSISAVLGNRGQADYAAANDALESLGEIWTARTGRRVLTVHWGPWAPSGIHTGMVGPELARSYSQRGITLIDPEEGPLALLRELAWGDRTATAVVHTASEW
ncbi:SDR family NAD(P)-dependent oxidoreductase [Streptomyces sp. NPDC127084]|uniref:SDR family NAD(P)-dependent oxidoreductase n=1 Tax=Streptomyces sp. NPDC127084 TaxID=3347133 RepID=UPI00364C54B5